MLVHVAPHRMLRTRHLNRRRCIRRSVIGRRAGHRRGAQRSSAEQAASSWRRAYSGFQRCCVSWYCVLPAPVRVIAGWTAVSSGRYPGERSRRVWCAARGDLATVKAHNRMTCSRFYTFNTDDFKVFGELDVRPTVTMALSDNLTKREIVHVTFSKGRSSKQPVFGH